MYAAIDLGTNTVRLLLGEVFGGKVVPAGCYRRITRLGGGFSFQKGLSEDAIQRTLDALDEFALILKRKGVRDVVVFGTAALRAAPNASEFRTDCKQRPVFPWKSFPAKRKLSSVAGEF